MEKVEKKSKFRIASGRVIIVIGVLSLINSVAIITMIPSLKNSGNSEEYKVSSYYIRMRELELESWKCKYDIVQEVEEYMTSIALNHNLSALELLNGCDKYNIDIRLALSQGKIESHFGTKGLAFKTNSVWNVGAYDNHTYDQIDPSFKKNHPNQSIDQYLKLIRESYLGDLRTEYDLLNDFTTIAGGKRYASNELYEKELRITWNEINQTTKLDSLLGRYSFLKRELNY